MLFFSFYKLADSLKNALTNYICSYIWVNSALYMLLLKSSNNAGMLTPLIPRGTPWQSITHTHWIFGEPKKIKLDEVIQLAETLVEMSSRLFLAYSYSSPRLQL